MNGYPPDYEVDGQMSIPLDTDLIRRGDAKKMVHEEWDECLVVDEPGWKIVRDMEDVLDRVPAVRGGTK